MSEELSESQHQLEQHVRGASYESPIEISDDEHPQDDEQAPSYEVFDDVQITGRKQPVGFHIDMVDDEDKPRITMGAAKRRITKRKSEDIYCDEAFEDKPDLGAYFGLFDLSDQQEIAICRTYANYLTSALRASGRIPPTNRGRKAPKSNPFKK